MSLVEHNRQTHSLLAGVAIQRRTQLTDRILEARDKRLVTEVCFLDMSKAFDKVEHSQLILDLFRTGVSGAALDWLGDYLFARVQQVGIAANLSRPQPCNGSATSLWTGSSIV